MLNKKCGKVNTFISDSSEKLARRDISPNLGVSAIGLFYFSYRMILNCWFYLVQGSFWKRFLEILLMILAF